MYPSNRKPTLHRYFSGLTEDAFHGRLGVVDPPMVSYLSDLLVRFVHMDAIYKVRNLTGRRLEEVADMLVEADERVGSSQREVHRHIGDFALFWTGLFPEALRKKQGPLRQDHFIDYCAQGKRSYYIASTYREPETEEESSVLERISTQFELCAYGLNYVRQELDEKRPEAGDQPMWLE